MKINTYTSTGWQCHFFDCQQAPNSQ